MNTLWWTLMITTAVGFPILVCCLFCVFCFDCRSGSDHKQESRQKRQHDRKQSVNNPSRPVIRSNSSASERSINVAIFNKDVVLQIPSSPSAKSYVKSARLNSSLTNNDFGNQDLCKVMRITEVCSTDEREKGGGSPNKYPGNVHCKSKKKQIVRVLNSKHSRSSCRSNEKNKLQNFWSTPDRLIGQPVVPRHADYDTRSLHNLRIERNRNVYMLSSQNKPCQLHLKDGMDESGQLLNYRKL